MVYIFLLCLLFDFECRATTHTDLVVRAKQLGVDVKVVHNASVMNAVGICGLQLYRYGETISIPFFTDTWKPDSFYEKIQKNRELGLHTLCLLGEILIFHMSNFVYHIDVVPKCCSLIREEVHKVLVSKFMRKLASWLLACASIMSMANIEPSCLNKILKGHLIHLNTC